MRNPVELVLSMPEEERPTWLQALAPDDAADLIQDAPRNERSSLLAALDSWPCERIGTGRSHLGDVSGLVSCLSMAKAFMLRGLT